MRASSLQIEGLRAASNLQADTPDVLVELPAGPAGIALLDALTLVPAACDPARTNDILVRLGVASDAAHIERMDEASLPVQATIDEADAGALIDPEASRQIRLRASFELDPPLFGSLRQYAVKDPRLVSALSDATLSLGVGLLWTKDLSTVSIDLLGLQIGGQPFSASGAERPPWLPELLHALAGRIHRVPQLDEIALGARLHRASLSSAPADRRRLAALARATAEPPFSLGALELVRIGSHVRPCFGPRLLRARQLGPGALSALNLATTVYLDEPDILLATAPDAHLPAEAIRAWLTDRTQGDDAVMEQILIASGGAAA